MPRLSQVCLLLLHASPRGTRTPFNSSVNPARGAESSTREGAGQPHGPNSKDKLRRVRHVMRERISEDSNKLPCGTQRGCPGATPTSPVDAEEEFFLLRLSPEKRSWRARRPILGTCGRGTKGTQSPTRTASGGPQKAAIAAGRSEGNATTTRTARWGRRPPPAAPRPAHPRPAGHLCPFPLSLHPPPLPPPLPALGPPRVLSNRQRGPPQPGPPPARPCR